MGHVPHLYLPGPWGADGIPLSADHRHHLERVLRVTDGSPLSYTDGRGTAGSGTLRGAAVERGTERSVARPTRHLTLAVAPPREKERARFLVEKLAELGVARLTWIETTRGEGRPPKKAMAWAQSALEQSRGAYLMDVEGPQRIASLTGRVLVADESSVTGLRIPRDENVTVVIGPEGGWAPGEVPGGVDTFTLGSLVLRIETAAIVSAAAFLVTGGAS